MDFSLFDLFVGLVGMAGNMMYDNCDTHVILYVFPKINAVLALEQYRNSLFYFFSAEVEAQKSFFISTAERSQGFPTQPNPLIAFEHLSQSVAVCAKVDHCRPSQVQQGTARYSKV